MNHTRTDDFGYIHVYTGNGKGKTTAAIGLTIRALGAQKCVLFVQLMKEQRYSECLSMERFAGRLDWLRCGEGLCGQATPSEENCLEISTGVAEVRKRMQSGKYDMVVLDELNTVVHRGFLPLNAALDLIDSKPGTVELVLTGRHAPQEFISRAHLVTEMQEVRHYISEGVQPRAGIEK
jgi:cob(I)alamin adenosyltransferase